MIGRILRWLEPHHDYYDLVGNSRAIVRYLEGIGYVGSDEYPREPRQMSAAELAYNASLAQYQGPRDGA